MATAGGHRCGDHADLHRVIADQHPQGDPARAGDRVQRVTAVLRTVALRTDRAVWFGSPRRVCPLSPEYCLLGVERALDQAEPGLTDKFGTLLTNLTALTMITAVMGTKE